MSKITQRYVTDKHFLQHICNVSTMDCAYSLYDLIDKRNLRTWIFRGIWLAHFALSLSIRNANASATRAAKDAKNAAPCTIRSRGGPAQLVRAFTARSATAMAMLRPANTTRKWPRREYLWISVGNTEAVVCASIARWDDKTLNKTRTRFIDSSNAF